MESPWGYIMKDEGRKKFKIDKWGIPGHPKAAGTVVFINELHLFYTFVYIKTFQHLKSLFCNK